MATVIMYKNFSIQFSFSIKQTKKVVKDKQHAQPGDAVCTFLNFLQTIKIISLHYVRL